MNELKLIMGNPACVPYYEETMGVHLYSIEELCYFLENNLFLLNEKWIGEELFAWLDEQLGLRRLREQLHVILMKEKDIYACVSLIFRESGYYDAAELEHLELLLKDLKGKTPMQCRKMRGDLLLEKRHYRQAAYEYLSLLRSENTSRMTEELEGDILHNLGVVYARMFQFEEAAVCFAESYRKRKSQQTREAYLFAMNYLPDAETMEDKELEINFTLLKDALKKFTDANDNADGFVERKVVSDAAEAFDWKGRQAALLNRWRRDYQEMVM